MLPITLVDDQDLVPMCSRGSYLSQTPEVSVCVFDLTIYVWFSSLQKRHNFFETPTLLNEPALFCHLLLMLNNLTNGHYLSGCLLRRYWLSSFCTWDSKRLVLAAYRKWVCSLVSHDCSRRLEDCGIKCNRNVLNCLYPPGPLASC